MASIRKSTKSRNWIACYTDETGKQRQRSTGETDRRKALRMAFDYEEGYRKMKTEAQARRVLSDIYEQVHGENLQSASMVNFFATWLLQKRNEVTPGTFDRYENAIKGFIGFLGIRSERELSFLRVQDIVDYRTKQAAKSTASTANINLKIIRSALQDAIRQELIERNPATLVQILKRKNKNVRRAFTLPELRLVLENAHGEWRGMVLMGLYTGQRMGDIAKICWNNIDLQREELRLVSQKTGRNMIVPLAAPVIKWLMKNANQDDPAAPVFPECYDTYHRHGRVAYLSGQFYNIMMAAGLAEKRDHKPKANGKGREAERASSPLSFHCLRHTATSLLKNAGVSEAVAMDIIGHDSKLISQNYTHIEESTKRKALAKLPDITRKSNG